MVFSREESILCKTLLPSKIKTGVRFGFSSMVLPFIFEWVIKRSRFLSSFQFSKYCKFIGGGGREEWFRWLGTPEFSCGYIKNALEISYWLKKLVIVSSYNINGTCIWNKQATPSSHLCTPNNLTIVFLSFSSIFGANEKGTFLTNGSQPFFLALLKLPNVTCLKKCTLRYKGKSN